MSNLEGLREISLPESSLESQDVYVPGSSSRIWVILMPPGGDTFTVKPGPPPLLAGWCALGPRVVCSGTCHTPVSTSSLCTSHLQASARTQCLHFRKSDTAICFISIILFATVSLLKIPPHTVPSWTNSTSHYSDSISLALLSQYPEWNTGTE